MLESLAICLLAFSARVLAVDCFTPNGTSRNAMWGYPEVGLYAPCNAGAKHSMCCRIGAYNGYGKDTCTRDNKFCQNASGDGVWRESCTDPTWQDPACQKLFVNGTGYPGAGTTYVNGEIVNDVLITLCDDGVTYCNGQNNRACCQAKQGVYLDASGIQRAANPNVTSTSTMMSSISSTSGIASASGKSSSSGISSASTSTPAASSSSGGLSTGAKAGIGVGVSVAALAVIALVAFFLVRRRRKQRQYVATKGPHQAAGVNPAQPLFEVPGDSRVAEKPGGDIYTDRAELAGSERM